MRNFVLLSVTRSPVGAGAEDTTSVVTPAKAGPHKHGPLEYGLRLSSGDMGGDAGRGPQFPAGHGVDRSVSGIVGRPGPRVKPGDRPYNPTDLNSRWTRGPSLDFASSAKTILRVSAAPRDPNRRTPRWTWGPSFTFEEPPAKNPTARPPPPRPPPAASAPAPGGSAAPAGSPRPPPPAHGPGSGCPGSPAPSSSPCPRCRCGPARPIPSG